MPTVFATRYIDLSFAIEPANAAMQGPHSLVRIGPGCADRT